MNQALSTRLFANQRLTGVTLERIWNAGIPAIEIFCARQHLDWRTTAQIREIGAWFRDSQLRVHSLHSPLHNDPFSGRGGPQSVITITEPVKTKRHTMVDEIKRVLEVAEIIPFRYLVQHLGVPGEEYDERKIDAAFSALEELSLFARQRGVEVLLQNSSNGLSTPERLNLFNEVTHLNLGYCFDTGHAHLTGSLEDAYRAMQSRIRSTHIHDNNGEEDQHLFPEAPGAGTIRWPETMDLLRSAPDRYPLLLDLKENPELAHPLDAVKRVFERLETITAARERE